MSPYIFAIRPDLAYEACCFLWVVDTAQGLLQRPNSVKSFMDEDYSPPVSLVLRLTNKRLLFPKGAVDVWNPRSHDWLEDEWMAQPPIVTKYL
jgi:hypothetical protein